MKKGNALLSLLLAVVMTATMMCGTAVSAKSTDTDTVLFDLTSLGIMTGDENGAMQLEQTVTRAEFAAIVIRLMGMEEIAPLSADEKRFADVPADFWAAGYINLLAGLHVIDGTGADTFDPDADITLEAVCKILVNILGYSMPANEKGGFPTGYMMQAAEIGLMKNVGQTQVPLTRGDVARLVYNALDVNMMVTSAIGSEQTYEVAKGQTLRGDLSEKQSGNTVKMTGIVTATVDTWLLAAVPNMTAHQIEINGKIYEIQNPLLKQYIGQWVDFFVYEDENTGKSVITSMKANSRNQVWQTTAENLRNADADNISYYTNEISNDYERLAVNGETMYVLNNRYQVTWTGEELMNLSHGNITMIDNDNDSVLEAVLIKSQYSAVVEEVAEENRTVYFKEGFAIDGRSDLELEPADLDQIVTLTDAQGNPISAETVEKGAVLSIFTAGDGKNTEVVYSNNTVRGTIGMIDEDSIMIGEELFGCEDKTLMQTVEVGQTVRAYLNYLDEVVYFEKDGAGNYAYVLETSAGKTLGADYEIRVLIPDTLAEKTEEVENEDGGENTSIAKIACKNKEIRVMQVASKASVSGIGTDEDGNAQAWNQKINTSILASLKGNVIAYQTNAQGQINDITFPEAVNTYNKKYYNSYERTFGKSSGGAFGVSEKTLTICIPDAGYNADPTDDDYMVNVEMNNGQQYTVTGYEVDEDSHTVELIAVTMNMKAGIAGVITTSSKVGFVNKVIQSTDANGDAVQKITMLTEGAEQEYTVSSLITDKASFRAVENGDLIAYSLDVGGDLDAVKVLGKCKTEPAIGQTDKRGDYETFCGYVLDAEFDKVSEDKNRWIHSLQCGFETGGSSVQSYDVMRSSGAPVFIYDTAEKKATIGTIKQIRRGYDKVFISATANSSTVRAIVVIR